MCGFAGFLELARGETPDEVRDVVVRMNDSLRHRGPDDHGAWVDAEAGVAIGHRRLSILDLSPEGHQPMLSRCGRFVLAFNGEIYNYRDLRCELERAGAAPAWRGHSDTEVMLAAIAHWGVAAAVERFNGMFAFALWDRRERTLRLGRDRLGEKPLYYGWVGDTFLFGSELKALRAHPAWRGEIDRGALAVYMRHSYVPAPYTIYAEIAKLLPGTLLAVAADARERDRRPSPVPYWSAREAVRGGAARPFVGEVADAISALDALLRDAVGLRMEADVPLGTFLSGGIDSSVVVALMQAQSVRPVRTFSIGFAEAGYNEAVHASAVAAHLGTEHTELYVTPRDAMQVIPRLPAIYDEPLGDSSQIPTFLVSEMARRHVTVSLSGDGGDELFGGYKRYFLGQSLWRGVGWAPRAVRVGAARGIRAVPRRVWDAFLAPVTPLLPSNLRVRDAGGRAHELAGMMTLEHPIDMYRALLSHWSYPSRLVISSKEHPTVLTDRAQWAGVADLTHEMMYLDSVSYLPDDVLVKVDRASMAVSLEARVPFLDHRVFEFAWSLPLLMKVRDGSGKYLLRQLLYKYVPEALLERPKAGFVVPIGEWLRGPLRDWAEALLDERRLAREGFLDPEAVRARWRAHLKRERNWQHHLWDVLMFQAWLEAQ